MDRWGTDEGALIRTLARTPATEIFWLKKTYRERQKNHRDLIGHVESETSGYFRLCLVSILRGPLQQDVWCLDHALQGFGTKETWVNDVLIGRSNADMRAIKEAYQHFKRGRPLEDAVSSDTSGKTQRMFKMIVAGTRQEDSAPVVPDHVNADVSELHRATEGNIGTDPLTVCSILSNRSDGQIRAIAHAYEARYHKPLEKVIESNFRGHMEDALVQMVKCGKDRAMRDAERLEECMEGLGTKDERLVALVVQLHWDRAHMGQVKGAYQHRYRQSLEQRIKKETRGDYEKCLIAMIE